MVELSLGLLKTNPASGREEDLNPGPTDWDIPEKIHTPPTDGTLEILTGGEVKGSGNPGRRGGLDLKNLLQGSFSP